MKVHVKFYDMPKYDRLSEKTHELNYEIETFKVFTIPSYVAWAVLPCGADPNDQYLALKPVYGDVMVFRNSYVDLFYGEKRGDAE